VLSIITGISRHDSTPFGLRYVFAAAYPSKSCVMLKIAIQHFFTTPDTCPRDREPDLDHAEYNNQSCHWLEQSFKIRKTGKRLSQI
jgi:hypothetical protein